VQFLSLRSIEIRQTLELRLFGPDGLRMGECLARIPIAVVILCAMIDHEMRRGWDYEAGRRSRSSD
jgi:hypothetical protein